MASPFLIVSKFDGLRQFECLRRLTSLRAAPFRVSMATPFTFEWLCRF